MSQPCLGKWLQSKIQELGHQCSNVFELQTGIQLCRMSSERYNWIGNVFGAIYSERYFRHSHSHCWLLSLGGNISCRRCYLNAKTWENWPIKLYRPGMFTVSYVVRLILRQLVVTFFSKGRAWWCNLQPNPSVAGLCNLRVTYLYMFMNRRLSWPRNSLATPSSLPSRVHHLLNTSEA